MKKIQTIYSKINKQIAVRPDIKTIYLTKVDFNALFENLAEIEKKTSSGGIVYNHEYFLVPEKLA